MNKEDVEAWISSPVTRKYMEYLQLEYDENKDISNSPLFARSIKTGEVTAEVLGLESLSRASVVIALDYAMDSDNFRHFCGGGDET